MAFQSAPIALALSLIAVAGSEPLGQQATSEAEVYAVLFEGSYHGTPPAAMVVTDAAVPMPTIGGDGKLASWLKQFDDLPPSLRHSKKTAICRPPEQNDNFS